MGKQGDAGADQRVPNPTTEIVPRRPLIWKHSDSITHMTGPKEIAKEAT